MKTLEDSFGVAVLSIVVVVGILMGGFIYKITHGFPVSYETEVPKLTSQKVKGRFIVLKSNRFSSWRINRNRYRNVQQDGFQNNWFLYSTEEGGVFNTEQLAKFDAVVFNNCTGRLLNEEQQKNFEDYVEQGGKLIGIHGAGDNSHHWIGMKTQPTWFFSPSPRSAVFEVIQCGQPITKPSPPRMHTDEWYVLKNPRARLLPLSTILTVRESIQAATCFGWKTKTLAWAKTIRSVCINWWQWKTFIISRGMMQVHGSSQLLCRC